MRKLNIVTEQWENSDHKIKLNGVEYYASKSSEWMPDKADRFGEVNIGKKKKDLKDNTDVLIVGDNEYPIWEKKFNKFFYKELGWVQVLDEDEKTGYVRLMKFRKSVIILLLLIIFAILMIFKGANDGVNPIHEPAYIADQAGIVHNNKEQHAIIGSYSAYESVVDQTWKAGEIHQKITLSLPESVSYTDKDGNEHHEDNPVDAAPHIYLDLNHDGEFSEDECVYNPIKYNEDGSISELGGMIKPGYQITEIDLVKTVDTGEYDAKVLWTGVTKDTQEIANPMTFKFHVTVK